MVSEISVADYAIGKKFIFLESAPVVCKPF